MFKISKETFQKDAIRKGIENLSFMLLIFACVGFFGRWSWFCDLFSHFRIQYVICSAILFLGGLIFKDRRTLLLNVIVALINLAIIAQTFVFYSVTTDNDKQNGIKIMSANVLSQNNNYSFVKQSDDYETLDMIILPESNHQWARNLGYLKQDFKYHDLSPRYDNFGISFFSKHPYEGGIEIFKSDKLPDNEFPYVWAEFSGENPFIIIGIHPPPPVDGEVAAVRDNFMTMLADRIQQYPNKRFIVIGDFNDTLWSYNFRTFMKRSGLKNTAIGVYETWPSAITGLNIFGLQIDHALVKGFDNVQFKIGQKMGSDHLPIILEVPRQNTER